MEETSNGFSDWEHLLSSSSPPPPETPNSTSEDPFLSIFPPVNHEGLPAASPLDDPHRRHPPSTSTASATDTSSSASPPSRCLPSHSTAGDQSNHQHSRYSNSPSPVSPVARWIRFALHLMSSRVASFLYIVRSRVLLFSFPSESPVSVGGLTVGVSLAMLGVWIWWRRRRRRPSGTNGDTIGHLILLIREKDEKIIELLSQVAQLNKLLLARYRVGAVQDS